VRYLRLLALLPLLLLAGCGDSYSSSSGGSGRDKVTIALDWTPNTNHTGVFVAKQRGWYDEEKLNVTILPYSEGATPDVQVAAGKADFGFSFEESVTMARAAGQPVVSLAAVIQQNSSALVALKDSGIDRPAKLNGKRYAGFGAPFEEPVINAIMACDGVSSPRFENVTTNTFGFQALQAKQADFVWIFMGWEGIEAQRSNVPLNAFSPSAYCIPNYYTPVIVTNETMTSEKADVVRRFMRATARGYELAASDPAQAADLLIKAAPKGSFTDTELVKESARFLAPKHKEGKARWGEQDLQVWTDYPRFMVRSGRLKDADGRTVSGELDYASFFTNDFLPEAPRR
jgi:ABC-type nitrate/sulfonate/bicarbonate transport system substrate-binding protein